MGVKRKIIISILTVLIGNGLIVYFIILPTIRDIVEIKNNVLIERIDLEKKWQRGQLLNRAQGDFEKTKAEKGRLVSIFIAQGSELEFITSLEQIAEKNNITQDLTLDQGEDASNKKFNTVSRLSVKAQGDFNDLLRYIDEIDKLSYYFNINSLDIRAGNSISTAPGQVTADFSGNIFIVKDKDAL